MKTKPIKEVNNDASIIAQIVCETHVDQRHLLYEEVARQLGFRSQFFQAGLFKAIANHDKGGR